MKPSIYWIGRAKVGVGKSILSMALVDYLLSRKLTPLLVESDTSNPDVWKMYRETIGCQLLDLDEVDGWIGLVNACDAHPDKIVIVNTAARRNPALARFGAPLGRSPGASRPAPAAGRASRPPRAPPGPLHGTLARTQTAGMRRGGGRQRKSPGRKARGFVRS